MRLPQNLMLGIITSLPAALLMAATPAARAAPANQVVRCESIDGRMSRCASSWDDARLVRQESDSSCVRDRSWGVDRQGLWVSHGCRGQFARAGRGHRGGNGPAGNWNREIRLRCESLDQRYHMCRVDVGAHGNVRLVSRESDSRCVEGSSWGWNRAGVWTSRGCRALFVVNRRR